MASARTPTGFMSVPREIRDMVYRKLLTTSATFDIRTEEYHMHPAILGVNKQISEEAGETLQNENNFVILELNGDSENRIGCLSQFHDIPRFKKFLTSRCPIQPALQVTVKYREETSRQPPRPWKVRIITGPEGIQPLIECFWRIALDYDDELHEWALNDFSVALTLHSRVQSKRPELQNLMLKPFRNFQGLGSVTLSGVDQAFYKHLLRRMSQGPIPSEAKQMWEETVATGEREYENANYRLAYRHWKTINLFQKWIYLQVLQVNWPVFYADTSVSKTPDSSSKELFRHELGIVKALIRLGEYEPATDAAQQCLDVVIDIFPGNDLLRGKLELCSAVAFLAFPESELADTNMATDAFWDSLRVITGARQGARSSKSLVRVLKDFFWAKQSFPEASWFRHFLRSRALWELLDNKGEEEWEGYEG